MLVGCPRPAATGLVHGVVSAFCKSSELPRVRVAYLINQYPKVSHTFIRREILALERLGVDVQRYALRGWDETPADEQDVAEQARTRYLLREGVAALLGAGAQVMLRRPAAFGQALRLAWRLARRADRPLPLHLVYLLEACRLLCWLEAEPVAHVHAHFGTNAAEVVMLLQALGGPGFSFTVHGPEEFDKPEALHLGDKAQAARAVVAISSFGRSQLWRWMPLAHWPKVEEVHCGLDAEFFDVPRRPVPDVPRLLCVGRLCEQKGQLLLVQAAAALRAQGRHFELVLAGDGPMRPDVEQAMARLGVADCVSITGWISSARVRELIDGCRALVLPSFAEGLPVVVMEAMARGRPVITTAVAGIPELVRDGQDGWLLTAGCAEALEQAMRACLDTPAAELACMGEAAALRVRERHHVDVEAGRLAALFRRVAASAQALPDRVASPEESR